MSTTRQLDGTYKSTVPECEIPNVDLLTLLFGTICDLLLIEHYLMP
jgi:hypothetical protein